MKKFLVVSVVLTGMAMFSISSVGAVSVDVQGVTGNVNIQASPGVVNVQGSGAGSVNVQGTGTGAGSVNVNGATINLRAGSLEVQTTGGKLDAGAKNVIVNLDGGSEALLKGCSDLRAYQNIVLEQRVNASNISIQNGMLSVQYAQPAKLLWVLPVSLNATVTVDSAGIVDVKMPWYTFLFKKNLTAVRASLQGTIRSAEQSGKIDLTVLDKDCSTSTSARGQARVLNIISGAVGSEQSVQIMSNSGNTLIDVNDKVKIEANQ